METIQSDKFDEVISNKNLTVIDFSASWCMPCRMLKPIMDKIDEKLEDVKIYNVDIDSSEDIAKRYRIFSVPTIVCFKEGKKIDSMVGLNPYDDIVDFIKRCQTMDAE